MTGVPDPREVESALLHVGAVQFGQFERPSRPGVFEPVRIHLPLLASYPETLAALARALAPMVRLDVATHLLAMPGALPVAFALSRESDLPLVYAAGDDPDRLEGAFDYNVPALLVTDVLADGDAETAMIRHAHRHGLDVEGLLAVYDLGRCGTLRGPHRAFAPQSLWRASDIVRLAGARSATLSAAVSAWLDGLKGQLPGA